MFCVEDADALGTVEFVCREREHIYILCFYVNRQVTDRLHRVGVKEHALCAAYGADLGYRHYRADLIVGIHDRDKAGVGTDRGGDLLGGYVAAFSDGEQLYLKALFSELFKRMKHRVVLERR